MPFPKREDILSKATEIHLERQRSVGLEPITPEPEELEESGDYFAARYGLMAPKATTNAQTEKYIQDMASELGLVVIKRQNHVTQQREIKGLRAHLARLLGRPKKATPILPSSSMPKILPKLGKAKRKRQKLHVQRNGKHSRKWTGRKVFSFPDDVWKVRRK